MRDRSHVYHLTNRWTGNLGDGTASYRSYSRSLELMSPGKTAPIQGSSDPLYRGDPARYNPEELMLGSLSACHMLWVLHLCADAGIVVTHYSDQATGELMEHPDGSGEFTRVVLHPEMTITDPARIADATALHQRAHALCAMARSVKFPVEHAPVVKAAE